MKFQLIRILFLLLFCIPFALVSQAQDEEVKPVIVIDYMKAVPGQGAMTMEDEMFRPVHQEMVNAGDKLGWYCFDVMFPNGDGLDYNYVTVNVYKDAKAFFEPNKDSWKNASAKAFPGKDAQMAWEKIEKARTWVKSEMFYFIDEAVPGRSETPAEYISVNYMKVPEGKAWDYVKMEQKVYKPLHAADAKAGGCMDWGLYWKARPMGAAEDYNFLTVDVHGTVDQMLDNPSNDLWAEVHPDKDPDITYQNMRDLRTLIRQETWKLASHTTMPESPSASK